MANLASSMSPTERQASRARTHAKVAQATVELSMLSTDTSMNDGLPDVTVRTLGLKAKLEQKELRGPSAFRSPSPMPVGRTGATPPSEGPRITREPAGHLSSMRPAPAAAMQRQRLARISEGCEDDGACSEADATNAESQESNDEGRSEELGYMATRAAARSHRAGPY
eukprot:TRINITY_DN15099_c0_g1_i1.p1 TRINITY_DN15099_c0_g1~~TRINITY_DN15099_c0_g1_i1.p1  ORF type:complete len:168 (-),score=19.93 TRINITY_DN15099_c0_g1_i1:184-687(-)